MQCVSWAFKYLNKPPYEVRVSTRYGLDCPGAVSRWRDDIFRTPQDLSWNPPRLLYNGYQVIPGVKPPSRGVDHPSPSSAVVKERIDLKFCSPPMPSWQITGATLYLHSLSTVLSRIKSVKYISDISLIPYNYNAPINSSHIAWDTTF